MRLKALLASLIVTVATVAVATVPAFALGAPVPAACTTQTWWPRTGQVATSNGTQKTVTLNFQMTSAQVASLRACGVYLEVNFVVQNAGVSGGNFTYSTNLPGAIKDVPLLPSAFSPGVTRVSTSSVGAGQQYFVTVNWTGGNSSPTFSADFIASHQASNNYLNNPVEANACANGVAQGNLAFCVFQTARHQLLGGNVALNGSTYILP
ncbi:MAG: hypothetical protein ABWY71_01625 [Candidatus Saccharimonadales bacterium]